jgi:hypothetical protein
MPDPEVEYVTRQEWHAFRNELATLLQDILDLIEP